MDDFYYAGGKKVPLQRGSGCFTVGISDPGSLDKLMEHFSHEGYKTNDIGLDNRFLVTGTEGLSVNDLRQDLSFFDVSFITPVYQTPDAIILLEDEIRVEGIKLNETEIKKFLSKYDLSLRKRITEGYQFKVNNPDDNKTLAIANKIYEDYKDRKISSTPRFKRVVRVPSKEFDFGKFFSS